MFMVSETEKCVASKLFAFKLGADMLEVGELKPRDKILIAKGEAIERLVKKLADLTECMVEKKTITTFEEALKHTRGGISIDVESLSPEYIERWRKEWEEGGTKFSFKAFGSSLEFEVPRKGETITVGITCRFRDLEKAKDLMEKLRIFKNTEIPFL